MTPTPTIRRYVSAAYTAMMRGQWDVASECFNRAHQECLVMASQPLSHVPAPGALAGDYLELASRATDPGAKAHWVRLEEEEAAAAAAGAAEAAEAEDAEEAVPEEEEAC